ncbi:MAG TPA: cold shock domain-containing protein [Burkholderiales bacterium]
MRYQGRISGWNDDRGYGFITPNGGGARLFLHISAFKPGQRRPFGDELVTYEIVQDDKKGNRAANVAFVGLAAAPASKEGPGFLRRLAPLALVAGVGLYGWQNLDRVRSEPSHSPLAVPEPAAQVREAPRFRCEGKTRCTEMTSCEEATFYLRNCPGVKIDGDMDGIPCEDQLCGH